MNKWLPILCLTVISLNAFGQGIKISNDKKSKTFKEQSIFEIQSGINRMEKFDCCNFTEVRGIITSIEKDSIQMKVSMLKKTQITEEYSTSQTKLSKNQKIKMAIAKTDILTLKNFKNLNKAKNQNATSGLGALLVTTGIITGLNSLLVSKGKNRNRLLISGGLQVGIGALIIKLGRPKKYRFKKSNEPWKFD